MKHPPTWNDSICTTKEMTSLYVKCYTFCTKSFSFPLQSHLEWHAHLCRSLSVSTFLSFSKTSLSLLRVVQSDCCTVEQPLHRCCWIMLCLFISISRSLCLPAPITPFLLHSSLSPFPATQKQKPRSNGCVCFYISSLLLVILGIFLYLCSSNWLE